VLEITCASKLLNALLGTSFKKNPHRSIAQDGLRIVTLGTAFEKGMTLLLHSGISSKLKNFHLSNFFGMINSHHLRFRFLSNQLGIMGNHHYSSTSQACNPGGKRAHNFHSATNIYHHPCDRVPDILDRIWVNKDSQILHLLMILFQLPLTFCWSASW
jgi:hypothetical protein